VNQETLLLVFIGMVAVAWFAMGVVAVLIGIRLIAILDEMQVLVGRVRATGEHVMDDVEAMRESARAQGAKVSALFEFLMGLATRRLRKRTKNKYDNEITNEI
jgi:hypothetical protein